MVDLQQAPLDRGKIMIRTLFTFLILVSTSCFGIPPLDVSKEDWPPQIVKWTIPGDKEITIIAVHHTDNLDSEIHKTIRNVFEKEKPDVYLMEGFSAAQEGESPQRLKDKSKLICDSGKCNENLYAAYLATINKVPFIGIELSESEQILPLENQGFTFEDLCFYMLVMEIPYFFRDGDFETHTIKFTPETWDSMCTQYLQKNIAEWLGRPVSYTYADFLKWWEKNMEEKLDMAKAFQDFKKGSFYIESSLDKRAVKTQKIAYYFHKNRDDHMLKVIKEAPERNKKILVIYGSNHLRDQWEQLIKMFGDPKKKIVLNN